MFVTTSVKGTNRFSSKRLLFRVIGVVIIALITPFNIFSSNQHGQASMPMPKDDVVVTMDTLSRKGKPLRPPRQPFAPLVNHIDSVNADTLMAVADSIAVDTILVERSIEKKDTLLGSNIDERTFVFNPNPTRAVWLSALFPGLGQIYNRRYWKLPIIVGGYMGLAYATTWNNRMLSDYTRAYRDIMDTDPNTKSYMDFFPPTTKEENLDKTWLTNTLQSRKNYFRQNRDLCIICMVGVYLLAMVDAYVDASLSQFDITPDLSMQVSPALIQDTRDKLPSVGLHWALCF